MRRILLYILLALVPLCGGALGVYWLWRNVGVVEHNGLASQGIRFTGPPYLRLSGSKDRATRLTIWTHYSTMSPECREAFITEDDSEYATYVSGFAYAERKGMASRRTDIFPGTTEWETAIPMRIKGPWDCDWEPYELRISVNDAYRGLEDEDSREAFFFTFTGADHESFRHCKRMKDVYDVLCKKIYFEDKYRMLLCKHGDQRRQNTCIDEPTVRNGAETRMNANYPLTFKKYKDKIQ